MSHFPLIFYIFIYFCYLFLKEQRQHQLEEKIRVLQTSKDELQSHTNQQTTLVTHLQHKNSNLQIEVDSLKRQIDDMSQVHT